VFRLLEILKQFKPAKSNQAKCQLCSEASNKALESKSDLSDDVPATGPCDKIELPSDKQVIKEDLARLEDGQNGLESVTKAMDDLAFTHTPQDSIENQPVNSQPIECQQLVKQPLENLPVGKQLVGEQTVEIQPVECQQQDQTTENLPVKNERVGEEPAEDQSFGSETAKSQPVRNERVGEEPAENQPIESETAISRPVVNGDVETKTAGRDSCSACGRKLSGARGTHLKSHRFFIAHRFLGGRIPSLHASPLSNTCVSFFSRLRIHRKGERKRAW